MARRLPVLVVAIGWLACAGLPTLRAPAASEEEQREFRTAMSVLEDDPAAAEQRLLQFARRWPQSPLAGEATLQLAELALARGDRETARRRFYFTIEHYPNDDRIDSARLGVALLEYERGNRVAAVRWLEQLRLGQLSDSERHKAHRLLVQNERNPVAKLRWLSALRAGETDPREQTKVDAEIDELLAGLDTAELDAFAERTGPAIPAARALLIAAERALSAGDLAGWQRRVEGASRWPMALPYSNKLVLASDRVGRSQPREGDGAALPSFQEAGADGLPATRAAEGTIGVVLPLSGNFAEFGEESLRGILLASGAFDALVPPERRPSIRIVIRDSGGSPARAAQAVRDLARRDEVSAIIGPLLAGECEAAAASAEIARVPLLALTARTEVAQSRSFVFRVRTKPSDEVRALADYAVGELGAQRFAILYPRDAYGRGLSGLFWDAIEERGAQVVALAAYEPDATDFADPIRRLVGYELLTDEEKATIKEREKLIRGARRLPAEEALIVREEARAMLGPDDELLPPIVDFDALFIPESHEKIVLIAPQLAFHEATGATLLGTDAWNHADLVSIARNHVEGARFTASFYADSSVDYVRNFSDRYTATFQLPADDLAAHAYDAANLVLVQLAHGARSRSDVRDGILEASAFPGVSGVLSMRADGDARKRPFLLGINRGRIVELD